MRTSEDDPFVSGLFDVDNLVQKVRFEPKVIVDRRALLAPRRERAKSIR